MDDAPHSPVKAYHPNLTPQSALLPPQAIIKDKDTWITTDNNLFPTPTK